MLMKPSPFRTNASLVVGSFAAFLCLTLNVCIAQAQPAPPAGKAVGTSSLNDNVDARIRHQRQRIKAGLQQGAITDQQAQSLRAGLDGLASTVAGQGQHNGGSLKPEQLKRAENVLNQSNQMIKSYVGAGSSKVDPEKVLGPEWKPGPDGAQSPLGLHSQMKKEEKRELRQYNQAMQQKTEQQQLDYERNMVPTLAGQRKNILKQQTQLKKIRQESGAN